MLEWTLPTGQSIQRINEISCPRLNKAAWFLRGYRSLGLLMLRHYCYIKAPSVIKEISYSKDDKSITFTWKPLVNIKSQRFHYQWYCNEFIVKEEDTWEKSAVLHVEPSKEYYITVCTDDGQGQRGKQLTSNKVHTGNLTTPLDRQSQATESL